jgi:uncharacterized RDD family membrane protein YckC
MAQGTFTYQTSEKVRISFETASVPHRIAAFCVDTAIRGACFFLFYFLLLIIVAGSAVMHSLFRAEALHETVLVVLLLLFALFLFAYQLIFELIWKGQTPGKRVMHLRAVNDDGSYMSFGTAVLRNMFRIVDMLPAGYMVGLAAMALNRRRKRVGDYVAGTVVIRENSADIPKLGDIRELDCFNGLLDPGVLFPEKSTGIIENYFSAKNDLSPAARDRVAREIVILIESRTGVKKPSGVTEDEFIGALYRALR